MAAKNFQGDILPGEAPLLGRRCLAMGLVFLVMAGLLDVMGFFNGMDDYTYDFFFRLRGTTDPPQQILIAAIDEKSLETLGRWPIERKYYAPFLEQTKEALGILSDIIFAEPTMGDKPFKEALARFPHMILAAYVNRSGHLVLPASSLGQPPVGHVHIEPGMDGVVRETYHTLILDGKELPSAAFSLYTLLAGDTSVTPDQLKSVDSHGLNGTPLYSILQAQKRRINYYGPPGTFPSISFSDILEKQYPQDYFKNKILVLGLTVAGVDQDHLTCFSQNRNRMAGVELQATILGNILDRSYIRTMGPIGHRTLGALFFLVTLLWMSKRSGSRALMTGAALFIGVTGGAFVLLSFFNFWVAPGIFWAGVAGAQVFGHIVHLEIMGQRLVQARQDWQTSFDAIDDAIIIKDKLGQPVLFNRAASYGAMEVLERHGQTGNPGPAQLFDPKLDQYFEIQQFSRQGKDGSSAGSVHVVRNITESTRLRQQQTAMQEQLIQSEKMDAIGALAGGIAHDFNNILSAIMGYTQLAKDEIQNNNKAAEHLEKVLKACSRSAELISQILSFSRKSPKERAPVMVGPIVKEVLQLLKATLPPTITLTADPGGNEMVTGDPNQIYQVLLNLCTNAFQAMGNRPGKITVTVKGIEVDRENLVPDLELLPGKYVQISVADTGPGIPEKIRGRVFEPYFTTKEKGSGTGLGLATTHGIVKNHGGSLRFDSSENKGTCFHVYLPQAEQIETSSLADEQGKGQQALGRLLLVDDQEELVETGRELLTGLGYEVEATTCPEQALKDFQNRPEFFDAVITDLHMKKMTGILLAEKLRKVRKDIPIVLCTGYNDAMTEKAANQAGISVVINKPFFVTQLSKAIQKAIRDGHQGQLI